MDSFARPPAVRCRGGARPSRRNAADPHGLPIKTCRPIASVAAVTAQPLAALPPYGCGVPLAGCDRHAGWQRLQHRFYGVRPPSLSLRGGQSPTWQSQAGTYESAGAFLCSSQSCEIATAPAEPRNDKSGSLPHPEGRNDKARSAPLPCHCEEGVSPTWQSQAGTYESAGAFLCSSQSCEIATAPAEPRNDKSGSLPLNVQKAPRVRRSDCRKSLAEFAPAGAKKMEIIFSGGVYVGENTARLANVRRACPSCAAASRSPFQTRAQ